MVEHIVNESCKERFNRIDSEIKTLTERVNKGAERIVKAEESNKSAHHRIDQMAEQTEAVTRLAVSVEHVVNQNKEILIEMKKQRDETTELKLKIAEGVDEKTVEKITDRLDVLEKKDGKKAEKLLTQIKWLLISLFVTGIFGLLFSLAFEGGK